MIKKIIAIFIYLTYTLYLSTAPTFAQGLGCGEGFGAIAKLLCGIQPGTAGSEKVATRFNTLISGVIGFLTVFAALWFLIRFILAGFQWISAGGDKTALETARSKIFNAMIGLLIVVAAWVIVGVFGKLLGLDILNPGNLLINLGI